MTINELFSAGKHMLDKSNVEDSAFDCDCIIESVFGAPRSALLLNSDYTVTEEKQNLFFQKIEQRCSGNPLQYILGEWDFYDMTFFVGDGVLIPRPETEYLVDCAADFLKDTTDKVVFDLCAGSGCIGLTLAAHFPQHRYYLFDISDEALYYTEKNREKYHLKNVHIIRYDIRDGFDGLNHVPHPDLILSNPPYIPSEEIPTLQREVQYEPMLALDGGKSGLDFYFVLAKKWLVYLNKNGQIAVESGEEQPPFIVKIFSEQLSDVRICSDYYGVDRFVVGRKGE